MSRFASCSLGERRFAALVDDDVVRPLEGVAELGAATPAEVLAAPVLTDERIPLAEVTSAWERQRAADAGAKLVLIPKGDP